MTLKGTLRGIWMRYQLSLATVIGRPVKSQGIQVDVVNAPISPLQRSLIAAGRYEVPEIKLVRNHLPTDTDIIELGAGVGVVTGTIDQHTRHNATQIAVEPNPDILPTLQRTIQLNDCVTDVVEGAYSPDSESVKFTIQGDFSSGTTTTSGGEVNVRGVSLSELIDTYSLSSFALVADIEGTEGELIYNEGDLISDYCPVAIIELHPDRLDTSIIIERMTELGFNVLDQDDDVYVFLQTSV